MCLGAVAAAYVKLSVSTQKLCLSPAALHMACANGHADIVKLLLDADAVRRQGEGGGPACQSLSVCNITPRRLSSSKASCLVLRIAEPHAVWYASPTTEPRGQKRRRQHPDALGLPQRACRGAADWLSVRGGVCAPLLAATPGQECTATAQLQLH